MNKKEITARKRFVEKYCMKCKNFVDCSAEGFKRMQFRWIGPVTRDGELQGKTVVLHIMAGMVAKASLYCTRFEELGDD